MFSLVPDANGPGFGFAFHANRGHVFLPLDVVQRHLGFELHRPAAVAPANGFSFQGIYRHSERIRLAM